MRSGRRAAMAAVIVAAVVATVTQAQSLNDWSSVAKDPGGSKFSPLTQITPANVSQLQTAWTYDLGMRAAGYTVTPIVVSNVLYFPVATNIVALKADTGKELWKSDLLKIPALGPNPSAGGRGISYWAGTPATGPRLVIATTNGFLVQLDREDRQAHSRRGAVVDMGKGIMDKFGGGGYAMNTPPALYKNLAIIAAAHRRSGRYGIPGDPRAFNL